MTKMLDCSLGISAFEFQSRYYIHLLTNIIGKDMNFFILPVTS